MRRDVVTMKQVVKKRSAIAIMLSIMTAVTFGAGYGAMSMAAEPTFAGSTVTASDEEDVFAFENSKERKTLRAEAEDFDDAFDLRAQGTVTPIKQQNPFGACWGFSAIAAAESSLLASGMAQPDDLDLSEKHLAWFAANALPDLKAYKEGEFSTIDFSLHGRNLTIGARKGSYPGFLETRRFRVVIYGGKAPAGMSVLYTSKPLTIKL